jgi:type IV pilus assembly protein PilC
MPLYSYKAKSKGGKVVDDVFQANNKKEVASALKSEGLQVLTIKSIDKGLESISLGKIKISEKAAFCRFMATMLKAGLTLPEAVDIIKEDTKNPKFKKIIYDISFQVRKGKNLSSILSKYQKDFGRIFITMIKAGEESGKLDEAFDYLSKQLLASYELTQKIKGALMYPAVIVVAMMGNFLVMMIFVLPKLSSVFLQMDVEMPKATEIVFKFGTFIDQNTLLVALITGAIFVVILLIFTINTTRSFINNLFLRMPLVRGISMELDIARFSRTLSALLASGVPITVSLEVSSELMTQPSFVKQAKGFSKGIEKGESLSEILAKTKDTFPSSVVQTIKAGEQSGSLEIVLQEMAEFYENEVDYTLKRLTSLIEPLLMIIIGIAVGGMVLIMITPIYSIVNTF